jgi:hypothetical protein
MVQPHVRVKARNISWCQEKQGYKMPLSRLLHSFPSRLVSLLANFKALWQQPRTLHSRHHFLSSSGPPNHGFEGAACPRWAVAVGNRCPPGMHLSEAFYLSPLASVRLFWCSRLLEDNVDNDEKYF